MHWSERIEKILLSSSSDLRELAAIAGFDPTKFYTHQDLTGCDLRGQDLRGMDLTGTNIENAVIDESTKIDPDHDPRLLSSAEIHVPILIPPELNTMVLNYNIEKKIKRSESGYHRLLLQALGIIATRNYYFYSEIIDRNPHLRRIVESRQRRMDVAISFQRHTIKAMGYFFRRNEIDSVDVRKIILVGLLANRIKPGSKKDYSELSLNAFYPPRLIKVEGSLKRLL